MRKILKYFGYIHYTDLISAAKEFDNKQTKKRDELMDESVLLKSSPEAAKNKFMDGLEEGWQGIGATRFVVEYLKRVI